MRSFDMKQKYFVMMLMGYLIPNLAFSADDLKSSSLLNQNPQNSTTQNTTTHAQQEVTIIDTNGNLKAVQKSVSTPIPSPSKVNPPPSQTQSAETSKNGKNVLPSSPNDSTAMQVPPDSSVSSNAPTSSSPSTPTKAKTTLPSNTAAKANLTPAQPSTTPVETPAPAREVEEKPLDTEPSAEQADKTPQAKDLIN